MLTDNNTTPSGTGKISNATNHNGSNEFLSRADAGSPNLDITSNLSVSLWTYFSSAPSSGNEYIWVSKLAGGGSSWGIRYFNNGGTMTLAAFVYDSVAPTTNVNYNKVSTLSASNWHHVVFTFNSSASTAEWFVDGSSVGTSTDASVNDINNSTASLNIGAAFEGANRFMAGLIDNVEIYNRILTGAEITVNRVVRYKDLPQPDQTAPVPPITQ